MLSSFYKYSIMSCQLLFFLSDLFRFLQLLFYLFFLFASSNFNLAPLFIYTFISNLLALLKIFLKHRFPQNLYFKKWNIFFSTPYFLFPLSINFCFVSVYIPARFNSSFVFLIFPAHVSRLVCVLLFTSSLKKYLSNLSVYASFLFLFYFLFLLIVLSLFYSFRIPAWTSDFSRLSLLLSSL